MAKAARNLALIVLVIIALGLMAHFLFVPPMSLEDIHLTAYPVGK